jgi:hypothetical protein
MATYGPAASADDASQHPSNGAVTINGTSIRATQGNWVAGRIPSLPIPAGSTITAASLSQTCANANRDTATFTVFMEAADSAAQFTTGSSNITNRTKTTASAAGSPNDIGLNTVYTTTGLEAALQEVIDRPGYAENNAVAWHLRSDSGDWESFAFDNGSSIWTFDVTWTAPAAGGQAPRSLHQFRLRRAA